MSSTPSSSMNGGALTPTPTSIELADGQFIDLLNPDPAVLNPKNVGHHLAQINRYNGAGAWPISVAEHSCLVAALIDTDGGDLQMQRAGLVHDAAEAVVGDNVSPLKYAMRIQELRYWNKDGPPYIEAAGFTSTYDAIETGLQYAVAEAFNVPVGLLEHPDVVHADLWALRLEAADLLPSKGAAWNWSGAREIPSYWPELVARRFRSNETPRDWLFWARTWARCLRRNGQAIGMLDGGRAL